jgi:hypothetical protein
MGLNGLLQGYLSLLLTLLALMRSNTFIYALKHYFRCLSLQYDMFAKKSNQNTDLLHYLDISDSLTFTWKISMKD